MSVSHPQCPPPDSPSELIQLQPVLSSIVLTDTVLHLRLLSLSGSPLLQHGDLLIELTQLLLPSNDNSISVLVN